MEERGKGRVGDEKRNRDKVHLREAMVEAAESEGDEEAHGSLRGDTRVRQRENIRGITGASVGEVVCQKKIERKRGTNEGCHRIPRIYERKQGTRNRMAAGEATRK